MYDMGAMTSTEHQDPPMSLHVVTTDGSPFDHALDGESFVIGRSSKADLTVPDRSMSRMHARLYFDSGMWHVEDLGSRNGTLLGGRPVNDPARLGHGSVVQVGSTSITLREATRPCREWGPEGNQLGQPHHLPLGRGAADRRQRRSGPTRLHLWGRGCAGMRIASAC